MTALAIAEFGRPEGLVSTWRPFLPDSGSRLARWTRCDRSHRWGGVRTSSTNIPPEALAATVSRRADGRLTRAAPGHRKNLGPDAPGTAERGPPTYRRPASGSNGW